MEMLAGPTSSLKSDVVQLSSQVQHHDQRMNNSERQLEDPQDQVPHQVPHHLNPSLSLRGDPGTVHPPKRQRTVLVLGGFAYDTEKDVICEKLREIFRQEPRCQRLVDSGEGRISGKGELPHERPCMDFPQKIQGQEVLPRIKAAVAHLGSPE